MIQGTPLAIGFNPKSQTPNLDERRFNNGQPWASKEEVLSGIPLISRAQYLVVNIMGVEYWFNADLTTLKLKTTDLIVTYATLAAIVSAGPTDTDKTYQAIDTGLTYKYNGAGGYAPISGNLALGETDSTAYAGNKGKELESVLSYSINNSNYLDRKLSTFKVFTELANPITKELYCAFLKDVKVFGTPQAGCEYVINAINWNYDAGHEYSYGFSFYEVVAATGVATMLFTAYAGITQPSGSAVYTMIKLTGQTYITKVQVCCNFDELIGISEASHNYLTYANGWILNKLYVFDTDTATGIILAKNTDDDVALNMLLKLSISDAVAGGFVSYVNPRGNDEYLGVGTYPGNALAYKQQLLLNTTFNEVVMMGRVEFGSAPVSIRIYEASSVLTGNIPDIDWTLLEEVVQTWDTEEIDRHIVCQASHTILSGKYLVVAFSTKTVARVKIGWWDTNPNSDRTVLMFCSSTNYSEIFEQSFLNASPGYWATPLRLNVVLPGSQALPGNEDGISINLPKTINATVGDKLQLFYRGIINAVNQYQYDILITCTKGAQYPRYFEYTPVVGDVGTTIFKVTVKRNNGTIIAEKTCSLITKAVVSAPSAIKKILRVGDSLTAYGVDTIEASRRLIGTGGNPSGLGLTNISFLGRKIDAVSGVGWEGTGGWTWSSFATAGVAAYRFFVSGIVTPPAIGAIYTNNAGTFTVAEVNLTAGTGDIRCTSVGAPLASGTLTKTSGTGDSLISFSSSLADAGNPFWYDGALDFTQYVDAYLGGSVDAVYFLLTWNGIIANQTDFSSMITTAKTLIDHIHTSYSGCKIKIMGLQLPSLNGGLGANYGATGTGYADNFGMVKTVFNLNEAYQDWANESAYSDFVEFVNVSSQFDSENNMSEALVPVNSRSTKTEYRGTNGVHPAEYGQIADIVFRNVVANYCQ